MRIKYISVINDEVKKQIAVFPLMKDGPFEEDLNNPSSYILVALLGEKVLGYVLLEVGFNDTSPNIKYVEVKKNTHGIGSSLVNRVIKYAKEKGEKEITLLATEENYRFFEKFGFKFNRAWNKLRFGSLLFIEQ